MPTKFFVLAKQSRARRLRELEGEFKPIKKGWFKMFK